MFKYGDIQNISFTPDKKTEYIDVSNAFLCHHIQTFQTFKNGLPCTLRKQAYGPYTYV